MNSSADTVCSVAHVLLLNHILSALSQSVFACSCVRPLSIACHYTSDKKEWTSAGGGSGSGSTLPQTATLRAALPKLVQKYNINSMLDSSCGSMFWMPLVLRDIQQSNPGFRFMGTDVVCSLIKKHVDTFKNESNWNFQVCATCINSGFCPSGLIRVWPVRLRSSDC